MSAPSSQHAERAIRIATKFHEARSTLKTLTSKEAYPKIIADCREVISATIEHGADDVMDAVRILIKAATDRGDGISAMWLMAAAVEMIEGEGDGS